MGFTLPGPRGVVRSGDRARSLADRRRLARSLPSGAGRGKAPVRPEAACLEARPLLGLSVHGCAATRYPRDGMHLSLASSLLTSFMRSLPPILALVTVLGIVIPHPA